MAMSLVDIRVDLPTHSHSFTVSVPLQYSVLQVKQEIYGVCPGQPRPEGQRLIWRGRLLADDETVESLWKTDPRIIHLAVHPSAWSSKPPEIPGQQSPSRVTQAPHSPSTNSATPEHSQQHLRPVLAYVAYQHQKALSSLSSIISIPNELETPESRLIAKNELKRNGWSWPDIFDTEFPSSSEAGLLYALSAVNGQPYLRLLNPDAKPTPRQEHALHVLTYTFTILYMPLPSSSPVRNAPTQSISIPPHVNQLLQQMGFAPLRVVNDNVVQAVANQNNPAPQNIREIPLRPLLAPLVMLFLRSMLLLYFVAPARKPIISILIFAWMLYEIWQPIRNGLRNGWGVQQQQQGGNVAGQPQNNIGQPNANRGWQPDLNLPAGPNVMADTLDLLANMNIADEEGLLHTPSGMPTSEPGVGRKIVTFVGLLASTLHPAIWNRRRVALRRREGTIRTEANARNAPPPAESGDPNSDPGELRVQVRDELRARFDSRPRWMQRYIQRVIDEDWVDDSD